ncbi:MAG: hypothetical protein PVG93_00625 [Phycisphaerales bacterium]|jgi:Tfp pilus assembly protein PilN
MFTIDLLKGQGIPEKSRPEKVIVAAIAAAVPVLVVIIMFGVYLSDRIAVSVQKKEVSSYQKKIDELSDSLAVQRSYVAEKQRIRKYTTEASGAINRHTQWTDILVTLVRNMPDSLVLTGISVEQRNARVKVPNYKKPGEEKEISVPARTLRLSLGGSAGSTSDKQVRDFRDKLRSSDELSSKLEDIIVSQEVNMDDGREVISYEMKCIFKPQI